LEEGEGVYGANRIDIKPITDNGNILEGVMDFNIGDGYFS
jgi:hypothetical protein